MGIANAQNLAHNPEPNVGPYGVRVRLRSGDPFARLVGSDWQKTHWYATAAERDLALLDMAREHEYSRIGDRPTLLFEKTENLAQSRGIKGPG
jgi:hypothetical protein